MGRCWLIVMVAMFALSSCASPGSAPAAGPSGLSPASGVANFRDKLATADQFALKMTGVVAPPKGQSYQGWLLGDDGTTLNVGAIAPGPDGSVTFEWNSPNSENLLNRFAHFQATLEPAAGSARPTGKVVFSGGLDGRALSNARQLFVRTPSRPVTPSADSGYGQTDQSMATPLNTAFAPGLKAQANVALQHVQNAVNADAIGSRAEMRVHLEHVINIYEGQTGPRFGDHDGNGKAEDPGDGYGVLNYSKAIADLYGDQTAVVSAAKEVQSQMTAIEDRCLVILDFKDDASATAQLKDLMGLAKSFTAGPVTRLYDAAQATVSFQVGPAQ